MTMQDIQNRFTRLPSNWHPHQGLHYPLELKLSNGESIIVPNYSCHHNLIKKLFVKDMILPKNPYNIDFL